MAMVGSPMPNDVDLETFLKSAGQSFTNAQKALVSGLEVSVNMMLSNAELELKVAVSSNPQGKMSIRSISSEDLLRGDIDPGMLSTIRISFVSSVGDIEAESRPVSPGDSTGQGNTVPDLLGMTLEEAFTLLKSEGWRFEPHAARSEEITDVGKESRGRVLRQQPTATQSVDRAKTTVHFWVDLGNIPVKELDGIGDRLGASLSKIGITTVGELGLANVAQISTSLQISESRAQQFVDMASLISHLAVVGFRDEVVELIVKGAGIRSLEQLADLDSGELFFTCQEAVTSGKVRVPREFRFTEDEIRGWISAARTYL
jgi:hypothetical protein